MLIKHYSIHMHKINQLSNNQMVTLNSADQIYKHKLNNGTYDGTVWKEKGELVDKKLLHGKIHMNEKKKNMYAIFININRLALKFNKFLSKQQCLFPTTNWNYLQKIHVAKLFI